MNGSSNKSGTLALRPRARIIHTLGDELISSESVAVLELVKNAYDADATHVLVHFIGPLETGEGGIEVMDNGHGMDVRTIQNTWMEPATIAKKRQRVSAGGRNVLGEKGIGRFAASRLANYLEVVSRTVTGSGEVRVLFDWQQFDENHYLDEVLVLWEEGTPDEIRPEGSLRQIIEDDNTPSSEDSLSHGTILRMTGLRKRWDRKDLEELRAALSRLVSPFLHLGSEDSPDSFQLTLKVPEEFKDLSGVVEPPDALNKPQYFLHGMVDKHGDYSFILKLQGNDETKSEGTFKLKDERQPSCGPFEIELRTWDRDADSMNTLASVYQSTREDVVRDLDAAAGINIYRNGFRVLPYGEPRNDWLRLDMRRVNNPTMRLSNNQIVGYVLISSQDNSQLRDQSNREGIIEGTALTDLRDLVTMSLGLLEERRYRVRHPISPSASTTRTKQGGVFSGFNLNAINNFVRVQHSGDTELLSLIENTGKDLERRISEVQEVLARYRRLATLGQLVDTVLHDGRTPLTKIGNLAQLCLNDLEKNPCDEDFILRFTSSLNSIIAQSHVVASVFRKIAPFGGRKRGKPKEVRLESIIEQASSVLDTDLRERGVKVSLPETSTLVTVDEAEIQQVMVNLLDNSLHWLREVPRGQRKIEIKVRRIAQDEVEILFSDSGPGVAAEIRDRIFDPYFSSKEDGVGLGLAIAGEIVTDYYGGKLELSDSSSLSGATFRITLNRRV